MLNRNREELEELLVIVEGDNYWHAFGVNEGKVEFIKQMLFNGATIEDISKMSGISIEEINSLLSKS